MNYQIERYTKSTLKALVESEGFLSWPVYPISPHRAWSYLNNPRLADDDVLIVMVKHEDQMIGYRSVLPDFAYNGGEKIKLAWLSGSWIHPDFRRKGLSTKLLQELYSAYNEAIIFTNYAPISKQLFDKSGLFKTFHDHNGRRFYLRSNTLHILTARWSWAVNFKLFFKLFDGFFNTVILPFILRKSDLPNGQINLCEELTETQVTKLFEGTLCRRSMEEFKWISKYPWIIDESKKGEYDKTRYHFSWIFNPYKLYTLSYTKGKEESLIMFSIKGRTMKIPYYSCTDGQLSEVSIIIFNEARINKVYEIDIFDERLSNSLVKLKKSYALSKKQNRKYMVSKSIFEDMPEADAVKVPDGEGEVVFV